MRSIIENIKEIEEENLKEVISLTNENDILKRRIAALKKDIEGTEAAVENSYNRGFFDAITKIKNVIDQFVLNVDKVSLVKIILKDDDTNTCRKQKF